MAGGRSRSKKGAKPKQVEVKDVPDQQAEQAEQPGIDVAPNAANGENPARNGDSQDTSSQKSSKGVSARASGLSKKQSAPPQKAERKRATPSAAEAIPDGDDEDED